MDRQLFVQEIARSAVSGALALPGLSFLAARLKRTPAASPAADEPSVLRPPGALDEEDFLAACIRCECCRDVCPAGCILVGGPRDGVPSGTPFILASNRACTLCLACTQVCPTGALDPREEIESKAIRIFSDVASSGDPIGAPPGSRASSAS